MVAGALAVLLAGTVTTPAYAEETDPTPLGIDLVADLVAAAVDDAQQAAALTDVVRRARSAVDGAGGSRAERSDGGRAAAPTLSLADLFTAYPRLSAEQREVADALLARPGDGRRDTYGDGYRVPQAEPVCGPRVCVHHVGRGVDAPPDRAWVRRVRRVMEQVWTHHVDELGYRAPAPDGGRGGSPDGRTRFDVYLADIGSQGYYGYCAPERSRPDEDRRASGYCVLDNDFAEFDGPPEQNLRVTAAHEFFHAVQFDYDVGEDRWFMEATAVWMEDRFAPQAGGNRQFVPHGQLGRPGVPLDRFEPTGLAHYGNWVFFARLADRYGVDVVRRLWERVAAGSGDPDEYSTQALGELLKEEGSSLRAFLAAFAAGNLTPDRAYRRADGLASAPLARRRTMRAGDRMRFATRLPHLSSASVRLDRGPRAGGGTRTRRAPRAMVLRVRAGASPARAAARVLVHLADGSVRARQVRLAGDGRDVVRVPFGPRVDRVTVTLVNASARYDCWQGKAYACAGVPRDDGLPMRVRAQAVR